MHRATERLDDHWRRLPWLAGLACLLWAALIYGFGLMLGHMSAVPDASAPIDAELLEERVPPKSVAAPAVRPPKPLPMAARAAPAKEPPARQAPERPAPDAPSPPGPPSDAPASSTPVNLPGTNLPAGSAVSRDAGLPGFQTHASMPPAPSMGSAVTATPPRFGAAYLNNPRPAYPPVARKMGMEGTVMLKVLVSREGHVLQLEVARSSGYDVLDKAAGEAVRSWRFVPAKRGETAVDEWVQVPLAFRLSR